MKMWNEHQETKDLMNELDNAEVEYEAREHGKIFINITNDSDELLGIWKIQYEPYWDAFKVIWYFLEDNEIKSAKTVCWDTQQILEDILG